MSGDTIGPHGSRPVVSASRRLPRFLAPPGRIQTCPGLYNTTIEHLGLGQDSSTRVFQRKACEPSYFLVHISNISLT